VPDKTEIYEEKTRKNNQCKYATQRNRDPLKPMWNRGIKPIYIRIHFSSVLDPDSGFPVNADQVPVFFLFEQPN
jgi:hypothetical protein